LAEQQFKGRREDLRLVTGRGRYTTDHEIPGQVYGHFLRADRAHAKILRIDIAAAAGSPGVIGILTGEDIVNAGLKSPPAVSFFKGVHGTSLRDPPRPALACERVRFVGEPVALVVAKTETLAQDAAELIAIDYEDLPVLVDAASALAAAAARVHTDLPDNLALEYEYGDRDAAERGFSDAAHVVRVGVHAQRIAGNPMEPKSCSVSYNAADDIFDCYLPSQGTSDLRTALSHVTGLDRQRFRLHSVDVGGGFGVRNEIYPEYVALLLAAKQFGRPVKWTGTRSETISGDHHGRDATMAGELALSAEGRFLAMRVEWLVNLGAYCSSAGPLINTVAAPTSTATSIYDIAAIHGLHRLVFTNTTPTTAYRGAGRPNVAYLWERLIEEAARVCGIDGIELRRRNVLKKENFPVRTLTGSLYDSADPAGLLARAIQVSGWENFETRRLASQNNGRLRGIGCALFLEPSGGAGKEEIRIEVKPDGQIALFSNAGPSGQGHETVFPTLVARILGLPAERVALAYNRVDMPQLAGTGSFGSRSLISHGSALMMGAREIIRKAQDLAAAELETEAQDLTFDNGHFRVVGTDLAISLQSLLERRDGDASHPLDTVYVIDTATSFPSGAHIAEVEIDPETGEIEILNYVAVDDCGTIYNHALVEGQLHGGMMQGIGQVLGEHVVYAPENGQLLSGTFQDYFMPRATDLPPITLQDLAVPSPTNPLGAKGAGEAGATGSVPALANAVLNALKPLGVFHVEMPFTPSRIWDAIQQQRAAIVTQGNKAATG
jgi:carbon-monoxide dehydrogenase large subunit